MQSETRESPLSSPVDTGSASILLINNYEAEQNSLRDQVEKLGYRTAIAGGEQEAFKAVASNSFDAALWDCSVPSADCHESLERLKEDSRNKDIAAIILCSLDQMPLVIRCMNGVADDYILKPPHSLLLGARIRAALERARFRAAERERTAELERISVALRQSNEDLRRFAYAASHDLQAPLRTITAHLQLLQRKIGARLSADELPSLEFPINAAMRMHQLVRDLLTYSQVSTNERKLEEVNCEEILADSLEDLNSEIKESGTVVTHDPLPTLMADPIQFGQLLSNLISNAIKYRREEEAPRIHVGVRRDDAQWHFWVKDNGEGIPEEYQGDVFKLFRRLHGDDRPGSGLGLAICQRIVDHLGGRIWLESAPDKGSTFHFTVAVAAGYSSKTTTALPR